MAQLDAQKAKGAVKGSLISKSKLLFVFGLLRYAQGGCAQLAVRNRNCLGGEIAMVVKAAVEVSSELGSLRSKRWTSAFEEDYRHDASRSGVGEGSEPAVTGAVVRAGPRLTQHRN